MMTQSIGKYFIVNKQSVQFLIVCAIVENGFIDDILYA